MLGDCQDRSDLLAWARKTFWLDWVDSTDGEGDVFYDWPYSMETRRVVAEKMMELCNRKSPTGAYHGTFDVATD